MKRVAILAGAALAACQSMGGGKYGSLPSEMVELYDVAQPGGWMEVEAERSGKIIEMETEIPVEKLPQNIVDAARAALPRGRVTGAERELVAGRAGYEVKMAEGGREYEFVYSADGRLLEKEMSLSRDEAPEGVVQAGLDAVPGSAFKSVERIEQLGQPSVYHVKVTANGATYKIVVDGSANVVRAVREQRVELEIPLR